MHCFHNLQKLFSAIALTPQRIWQGIGAMVATISRNLAELENKGNPVTSIYEQTSVIAYHVSYFFISLASSIYICLCYFDVRG